MPNPYLNHFASLGDADLERIQAQAQQKANAVAEIEAGTPSVLTYVEPTPEEQARAIAANSKPATFPWCDNSNA